jgi:hypothetical protein
MSIHGKNQRSRPGKRETKKQERQAAGAAGAGAFTQLGLKIGL